MRANKLARLTRHQKPVRLPADVDTPAVYNALTSRSSRTNLHKRKGNWSNFHALSGQIYRHSGISAVGNDYSHPEMTESSSPNINNNARTGPLCTREFFLSGVYQIKQNTNLSEHANYKKHTETHLVYISRASSIPRLKRVT